MQQSLKEKIIQSLIDQKEIFGDELFEKEISKIETTGKTDVIKEPVPGKPDTVKEEHISTDKTQNLFAEDWENSKTLYELEGKINTCTKCPLHKGRTNFVFGEGNPDADVLVIGEGPGAEEDKQGRPFVGRAGKLLNDILKAIDFERDDVYIANVVKCRPPGNRTPEQLEMDTCLPYLQKQIEIIKPKLILCLGLTAAKGLLKKNLSLTKLRGSVYDFEGAKVIVTYHPAALLRNPNWKRPAWEDVKKLKRMYDEINS